MLPLRKLSFGTLILAACSLLGGAVLAEGVPVKLEWAILFKVLGYDHNLVERCKNGVRIGVVSSAADTSEAKKDLDQIKASADNTIRKLKIVGFAVFVDSADKVMEEIRKQKINVVYLTSSAMPYVSEITDFCKNNSLLALGANEQMVKQGVAVAIVRRGNKPKILINVVVAKSQGAEFDFRLIRLAEVIK